MSLESKIVNLNKDWQAYVQKMTQEIENNEKDTKQAFEYKFEQMKNEIINKYKDDE